MVMRSFKRVALDIKVDVGKAEKLKKKIEEEFGNVVTVNINNNHIIVEGEGLSDHQIHNRIIKILTEE